MENYEKIVIIPHCQMSKSISQNKLPVRSRASTSRRASSKATTEASASTTSATAKHRTKYGCIGQSIARIIDILILCDNMSTMLADVCSAANLPSMSSTCHAHNLGVHLLQCSLLMTVGTTLLLTHEVYYKHCYDNYRDENKNCS